MPMDDDARVAITLRQRTAHAEPPAAPTLHATLSRPPSGGLASASPRT